MTYMQSHRVSDVVSGVAVSSAHRMSTSAGDPEETRTPLHA